MLVRIVKNWDYPDLMRQTPGGEGVWDGIQFTLAEVKECDFLIILNDMRKKLEVDCPPGNVWAIFQEPYVPGFFPWMRHGHRQFARVYTCHAPRPGKRYHLSQPMVPWHVGKSYDECVSDRCPEKKDRICWVTSDLAVLPGHKLRHAFYRFLQSISWPELEIWGRGIRPVEDKWDALAPSKYAIAIENYRGPYYWTEKISDCWLAYSLPFYYGCQNLEEYFPPESFIRIDLSDFSSAVSLIRRSCEQGEYEKRYSAICEARQLLLDRWQFFPALAEEIGKVGSNDQQRRRLSLQPFGLNIFSSVKEKISRLRTT